PPGACARERRVADPAALGADYAALRHDVGAVWVDRDIVQVSGPDAVGWLQGQLSQDVEALPDGGVAWSFLLEPSGKTVAWLRVVRVASDVVRLDADAGAG